jgi:hypothetical protein
MAGGEVKLKIGADTADLEKAFTNLIKKIQSDADKLNLMPTGARGAPATPGHREYQQAHTKAQQATNDKIAAEASNRILAQKESTLARILQLESRIAKTGGDTSVLAEKRLQTEKAINNEKKASVILSDKAMASEVRGYKELFSTMESGFKSGGMAGLKKAWADMNSVEKIGMAGTTIGGVLGGLGMAADYVGRRPIDMARMQASAISMTTGRQLGEARSGEYTYQGMYGDTRQKAQDQAASSKAWGTAGDILKLVGGVTTAAVVAGSALATGGLSLAGGAAIVGGLGMAGSAINKGILDPSKYAAYRSQQEASDFTTMLASLQEMSPYKKDAIERMKATAGRDIGMERTLGLKDSDYLGKGGYLQRNMNLGFTDDMVTNASAGIIGAGGSSAMARQSGTALQAERGLDLTNSQQLLGQLSGTQSIPETSKKSLIDIFARGFDTSKYAEENRKYMQSVTEQVYRGGSTSVDAADKIADMIRSTISGAPTSRNIEAGKTAFEAFQTASTATSGYLGGINVASAMQDKDLRKIKDPAELQALLKLKPNEIDETDPDFIESAQKMGLTGSQLSKKLRDRQVSNIKTALGGRSGMGERGMISTLVPGLGAPEQKAFANLVNQQPSPQRDAEIQKLMTESEKKMAGKETGRAGDTAIQASSKNAQISLETLSESINKFAADAMKAANKLGAEAPVGRAKENSSFGSDQGTGTRGHRVEDLYEAVKSMSGSNKQKQGN